MVRDGQAIVYQKKQAFGRFCQRRFGLLKTVDLKNGKQSGAQLSIRSRAGVQENKAFSFSIDRR
jgi:hypothetical protein